MNKEERQAEKLRRQQNRIANKMLIPAPKKTVQSLKLLNFDPSGTFHLWKTDGSEFMRSMGDWTN